MNGPQAQFEHIFLSTKEFLYGYIRKFVESDADAQDILQQCYINLWLKIEEVKDLDNVLPLLYTYSRNLVVDAIRKKAVEKKNLLAYSFLLEDKEEGPFPANRDVWKQMDHALSEMPERKRMIFLLRKEQGLSAREIAEQLNISPRAVRRHLEEAVLLLKNHLSTTEMLTVLTYAAPLTALAEIGRHAAQ